MKELQVCFIKDASESYGPLIQKFSEETTASSHFIELKDLLSPETQKRYESVRADNLIFVIQAQLYFSRETEVMERFRELLRERPLRLILVDPDREWRFDEKPTAKDRAYFFLDGGDLEQQAANFHETVVNLHHNAVLNSRLTEYIYNSFTDIISTELLKMKNQEIEALNEELKRVNRIDSLTNLYNRNALYELLENERRRAVRDLWRICHSGQLAVNPATPTELEELRHRPEGNIFDHFGVFSVCMIDIDHFKRVNDQYGHLMGDKVLTTLGQLCSLGGGALRETDTAARFGGEEFIVVLPETNARNSLEPARRLAENFKLIPFLEEETKTTFHVTLSIGISEYHLNDKNIEDIIHRADKALYYSKEHGRDTITIFEDTFVDGGDPEEQLAL